MDKNNEIDISEYYQTPLSSLAFPEKYAKLIKRIMNLNNSFGRRVSIKSVGEIVELEPENFAKFQGIGTLYVDLLVEFKKELPYLLSILKKEPNFVFKEDVFTSPNNVYDFETSINELSLSPKYQKLIKRILTVMKNIKTVQDIININVNVFSTLPAIGNLYVELLVSLQNALEPKKIHKVANIIEEVKEELRPQVILSAEQLETPLNTLSLSSQHQKLIKRISNAVGNANTIQDIINIDPISFSKLSNVGKTYVTNLIEFQKLLPSLVETQSKEKLLPKITLSIEKLEIPLSTLSLITKYQRLINRISTAIGNVSTVKDIIDIDPVYFSNLPAVGKIYATQLIELQNELPTFLESQSKKSALFNDNYSIDFNEIDNILLEDVENYLWSLDEKRMDIALSRWGFNQQHETLEEVAIRYNITRERIRQLEKTITFNLPLSFRILPKILWVNIREKMTEDLTILLPNLAKCFSTEKLFYEFIELCCQVESGSIQEIVFTKINPKIIHQLFCKNQSPIAQEVILNELVSNYGYSKAAAINGIKNLNEIDKIKITEQGIYPKNLGKEEAVAHTLAFHSSGLPWKDIARIINKKDYSKTPFHEERQATSALSCSEYVYLSGLGTYRNLMFLDIEQIDIPETMQSLLNYFKKNQLTVLHLHDYYYQTKNQRDEIEYFTLRHLIRNYGEEYGIYFNGKSGTDSVSLDSEVTLMSQADVIIKVLNESKVALTKQEIAERLRSKSTAHATFYINMLTEEGKVVRVDKMVYTTPEKAFSNMDTKAIMQVIQDIMNTSNDVIVEADIFREYVNMELNLSYSKYIYVALVKTQLKELGWYCNYTLFSKNSIPYNSLIDMCKQLCNPELLSNQNAKIIQKAVWLTDAVAADAVQQWKWQMSH